MAVLLLRQQGVGASDGGVGGTYEATLTLDVYKLLAAALLLTYLRREQTLFYDPK